MITVLALIMAFLAGCMTTAAVASLVAMARLTGRQQAAEE